MNKRNLLLTIFLSAVFFSLANLSLAATMQTTALVNGVCGSTDGKTVSSIPTEDLCSAGTATTVFGPNPGFWWYCEGSNGGVKVACRANYLSTGSIKLISPVGGEKWKLGKTYAVSWEYTSLKGDVSVSIVNSKNYSCGQGSAPVESKQLIFTLGKECKYADSQVKKTMEPGEYIIALSGRDVNGKTISYAMENGNPIYVSVDTITAAPIKGVCGSANGKTVSSIPSANLCSSGIASSVMGEGPWTWDCNGLNNGETVSCKALSSVVEERAELVITRPVSGSTLVQGSKSTATWTGSTLGVVSYSVCLVGGSLGALDCKDLGTATANQHSFVWTVPNDVTPAKGFQLVFKSSGNEPIFSSFFAIDSATAVVTPTTKSSTTVKGDSDSQGSEGLTINKPISQMTREELINILLAIIQALSQQKRVAN